MPGCEVEPPFRGGGPPGARAWPRGHHQARPPGGGHAQPEDLESLEETLAILSDPELMAELRQADAEVAAGRTIPLSKQEALAELER